MAPAASGHRQLVVALVTGANTGIGFAIATRLARDGYRIGFATRERDEGYREAYDAVAAHAETHWVAGDLADPDVPVRIVRETAERFGRIDVLVNNAGISTSGPALELTCDDFDVTFAVDVRAAFLAAQAAARRMVAQGGGAIVNITSVHEHVPRTGFAVYAAAKAALGMLTRGLALELGPRGVRVNAVAPGVIATARNTGAGGPQPDVPLGRAGEPEEVAALVSWLVSDDARYVTGASYLVDGGLVQQVFDPPAG